MARTIDRNPLLNLFGNLDITKRDDIAKTPYKVKDVADILGKDKDGNVICIPVKKIERNWSFQKYEAKGELSADLFIPKDSKINSC
eukprot:8754357-Ditylum_brightwellii.AAC.1